MGNCPPKKDCLKYNKRDRKCFNKGGKSSMAEVNAVEKQPVTQEYLKKMDGTKLCIRSFKPCHQKI